MDITDPLRQEETSLRVRTWSPSHSKWQVLIVVHGGDRICEGSCRLLSSACTLVIYVSNEDDNTTHNRNHKATQSYQETSTLQPEATPLARPDCASFSPAVTATATLVPSRAFGPAVQVAGRHS